MRLFGAALAALVLAAPASAAPRVHAGKDWFRDAAGRARILHGVAVMDFGPKHDPEALGFGRDDVRFLVRHGVNAVRLGFNWEMAEPRPGEHARPYLQMLRRTVRRLGRAGIVTILDAHQDGYGPLTGTDGAPAWATLTDGQPNNRIAFGVDYFANPALLRAFDNLYSNAAGPGGVGVADRFATMWAEVARATRREPGLLGYELLNEPYPGSGYAACANPLGCPETDALLSAFYRRVTAVLRAADPRHTVLYEPFLFFDFGAKTSIADPSGGRPDTAFAFHDYCLGGGAGDALPPVPGSEPGCAVEEQMVIDNAREHVATTREPLIVTEWAATDDHAIVRRMVGELDAARLSETFWQYNTPRFVADLHKRPAGANLDHDLLEILERPYPRVVAGDPGAWGWDDAAHRFRFDYKPAGRKVSEVWIPRRLFPAGYVARARGARVLSGRHARRLRLRARRGARAVRLTVRAPGPRSRR